MKVGRKTRIGVVISDKGIKTITVNVLTPKVHNVMQKRLRTYKKFKAHDEKDECKVGYVVKIEECRPISRTKRWKVVKVLSTLTEEKIELKDELEVLKPKEEPAAAEEKPAVAEERPEEKETKKDGES